LKNLKFPDGYAANLKRAVNILTGKMNGLKSHDYHIIMERLLPVMLRGYLPEEIWTMLAELSFFYRQLCAKEINKNTMIGGRVMWMSVHYTQAGEGRNMVGLAR
jgi:hypothetical protein